MNAQHQDMTIAEINECSCDTCVTMNAAIGIGESLAEIEDALEWLPRRVDHVHKDREKYVSVLRFIIQFEELKAQLLEQVGA